MTPQPILDFWFEGDASESRDKWFDKDAAFDADCARFTAAIRDARAHRFDEWASTPHGALALIILLDQLSRNVFRGLAEAYAADPQAREIAHGMIAAGFDLLLTRVERMFVYLPFEHSETLADQDYSVRLYDARAFETVAKTPPEEEPVGTEGADHAHRHRDVIRRFGRFPHRNAVLGRINTPEEEAYLAQPGAGF
jgi:uncharacterized protein (DUF924 family)